MSQFVASLTILGYNSPCFPRFILDLNLTPQLSLPENEFVACGPGSRSGLLSIFGPNVRGIEEDAVRWLVATQNEHWDRLGIADSPSLLEDRMDGVSVVDVEHALCECAKYIRGTGGRENWEPSTKIPTSNVPAKLLSAPPLPPPPTPSGDILDDESYEISHIISRRADGKYRVRWVGWGPEWDEWFSEEALDGAEACLEEWKRCASWQKRVEVAVEEAIAEVNK